MIFFLNYKITFKFLRIPTQSVCGNWNITTYITLYLWNTCLC